MDSINESLRERIRSARALPSPPIVTARLIELGDDPATGIDAIIGVLKTDPALAARLLRLANSPLYARRRRTDNLRQAVMLLGVDAVLTASLSLTLLSDPHGSSTPATFRRNRWARSVHAAVSAQTIAAQTNGVAPADAFLASLLQDIGVQVVGRIEPDAYNTLDPDCVHQDLISVELDGLGADHAMIGAELLESWKLPNRIVAAVRASHDLGGPLTTTLSTVVTISGLVADGMAGDSASLRLAADASTSLLGMTPDAFGVALAEFTDALPDLALILEATVPNPELLAEMAQDVIVTRHLKTQSTAYELHEQLTTMQGVAADLKAENRLDALTGLANRRALDDVLKREFELAKGHGFPMSVLFIDLDDFKKVNDRFGHKVGDELLIQTARRISACVRDGDFVGRFGGEEFIVVLPGASIEASDAAARRLIDFLDARSFELGSELAIVQTASIGAATLDESCPYRTVEELVHAADVALYDAKRSGKNRWRRSHEPFQAGLSLAEALDDADWNSGKIVARHR